jgi:apolipoprotein N-acyltransferase
MRMAGAVASGGLVALLFPPFNIGPLAWLALVPLCCQEFAFGVKAGERAGGGTG